MLNFIIEREIPEVDSFTEQDLQAISQKSCDVSGNMRPQVK